MFDLRMQGTPELSLHTVILRTMVKKIGKHELTRTPSKTPGR